MDVDDNVKLHSVSIPKHTGFVGIFLDSLAWWLEHSVGVKVNRFESSSSSAVLPIVLNHDHGNRMDAVLDMRPTPDLHFSAGLCWKRTWSGACSMLPRMRPLPPLVQKQWEINNELYGWSGPKRDLVLAPHWMGSETEPLTLRRRAIISKLRQEFGDHRVDTSIRSRQSFWRAAVSAKCVVHVAGLYPGYLDRTVIECMAHGVPVVTDVITNFPSAIVIEPFKHYVPAAPTPDGFVEAVRWVYDHESCLADISDRARQWYRDATDPSYVLELLMSTDPVMLRQSRE